MGNFDFLKRDFKELFYFSEAAENNVFDFPGQSIMAIRAFAEELCKTIIALEGITCPKGLTQEKRIDFMYRNIDIIPEEIINSLHYIRKKGNKSTHDGKTAVNITVNEAMNFIKIAFMISRWFSDVYIYPVVETHDFIEPLNKEIKWQRDFDEKIKKLTFEYEKVLRKLEDQKVNSELKIKRKRISRERQYPEKDARILIDQQLVEAGWECNTDKINYKKNKTLPDEKSYKAIAEWPVNGKWVDYALFIGKKLVGIIEAKPSQRNVQDVLESQAKDYAKNIEHTKDICMVENIDDEFKVPFIYASNGRNYNEVLKSFSGIWFFDARYQDNLAKPINNWHSPEELKDKLSRNKFKSEKFLKDKKIKNYNLRPYQEKAVNAIENAIINNQQRMLLCMATGTGKTRTALTLAYRLLEAERFKRILYIVDRTSLGDQTKTSSDSLIFHDLSFNDTYKIQSIDEKEPDEDTRFCIATIQSLLSKLKRGDLGTAGRYDFIIVDEAHRGYRLDEEVSEDMLLFKNEEDFQSQYKRVIDYFDAPILAMTATPTKNTINLFNDPIYEYTYTEAVIDDVLVNHDEPIQYHTLLSKEGIHFEKNQYADYLNKKTGKLERKMLPDELNFDVTEFNQKVINEDFNKTIAEYLADDILIEDHSKTLIFAKSDIHADSLVHHLKAAYRENGVSINDSDIIKITGSVKNHNKLIRKYKNEQSPKIVVTVDLLTTGIDIEDIVNLVFVRVVRSRVLYEQMLGRATRKSKNFEKNKFYIYDAVGIYNLMEDFTEMKPVSNAKHLNLNNCFDRMIESENEEFIYYRDLLIKKLKLKINYFSSKDILAVNKLIDNNNIDVYIEELKNFDRDIILNELDNLNKLIYYIDYNIDTNETIISQHNDKAIERTRGFGKSHLTANEYLKSFDDYINSHIDNEIIKKVINYPSSLTYNDYKNLKILLFHENFNEDSLNLAYKETYREELESDLINFIRFFTLKEPLISTEHRIQQGMSRIKGKNEWNKRQKLWLDTIEKQLINNIVLGASTDEFFENNAVLKNEYGGIKIAKKVFKDLNLDSLIKEINELIYEKRE